MRLVAIDPVVAPSESCQDLVPDRAGVSRRRIETIIVVEKVDRAAGAGQRGVHARNVENDKIHRNSADKRHPRPTEATRTFVAQRTQPPVRVADRNGCEAARMVPDMFGTVADRVTAIYLADLQDSALEPNDLAHWVG